MLVLFYCAIGGGHVSRGDDVLADFQADLLQDEEYWRTCSYQWQSELQPVHPYAGRNV